MKIVLLFLAVAALAYAVPVEKEPQDQVFRTYLPEEENPYRRRFILAQDGDGKLHIVDLFKEDPRAGEKATINDVTFYLFTRNNPTSPDIIPANNFNAILNSRFLATRQNIFVTHGWNNNWQSGVNQAIRPAALQAADANVFIVDWSGPANLFYTSAMGAVLPIGNVIGDFINTMMSRFSLTPARFNLVGHSLGAHVSGNAGARINGLANWINGLDPAGPLFTVGNINNRIDPTDGSFVQIIHTNSNLLGFSSSIGHADFRPNGGNSQPGCGIDLAGTCAHGRAFQFFAESLTRTGSFPARRCNSMGDYNNGNCNNNDRRLMGGFAADSGARGDYFLATNSNSPFGRG